MAASLDTRPVFNSTTLTASYVTQTAAAAGNGGAGLTADYIECKNANQVSLACLYTPGSDGTGSVLSIKVEFANPVLGLPVSADWMQEITETVAAGTLTETQAVRNSATGTASTAYPILISLPIAAKFIRFSIKETKSGANFGTVTLKATLQKQETFN